MHAKRIHIPALAVRKRDDRPGVGLRLSYRHDERELVGSLDDLDGALQRFRWQGQIASLGSLSYVFELNVGVCLRKNLNIDEYNEQLCAFHMCTDHQHKTPARRYGLC